MAAMREGGRGWAPQQKCTGVRGPAAARSWPARAVQGGQLRV